MQAYRIVEWCGRYEVTNKGKAAVGDMPVEGLKKGTLLYIRSKIYGHRLGPAFRKMNQKAWPYGAAMQAAAFGVFHKLLELAGDQQAPYRGWILDEKQRPIDADQIAYLLEWDKDVVARALEVLAGPDVGWLELVSYPQKLRETSGLPNFSRGSAEKGGRCGEGLGKKADAVEKGWGSLQEGTFKDESESESNITKDKSKGKGGDSILPVNEDSDSDSEIITNPQVFVLKLAECFRGLTSSDHATFRNLGNHLNALRADRPRIFNEALALAGLCRGKDNPQAYYTHLVKERYGFGRTVDWHSREKKNEKVKSQYV